jgi:hypothetical protein
LHWVQEGSNTHLKSCVWIFSMWTKMYSCPFHHDSRKWFFKFRERYLSIFPSCLIRINFSKHIMEAELHGYQRKEIHMFKWCLRVLIGLGSLMPLHLLLLFFHHVLCYQRFLLLEVEMKDLSRFFFTLNLWLNTQLTKFLVI